MLIPKIDRLTPGSAKAYAFAVFCIAVASLARWAIGAVDTNVIAFPTFYPAVLFAALLGGVGPGVFAAVLGGIIGGWALLSYLFAALLIVWGADHYRKLAKKLAEEEALRTLTVQELSHRLKNKVATIQAVVRLRLRQHPIIASEISASLDALSSTDDMLMIAEGRGARLQDIISAEVRPYDPSRISAEGPDVQLPPKLALVMTLLIHELTTNAAKYGALSNSTGSVSIKWLLDGNQFELEWCEIGGPIVAAPNYHGFGTRLFTRALEQFGGNAEANFDPAGLVCTLRFKLPNDTPALARRRAEIEQNCHLE